MADTRGVFRLKNVRNNILNDEGVSLDDVWIDYPTVSVGYDTGYFGGGAPGSPNDFSTMDKLDYSTDTTAEAPGAALSVGRYLHSATGNSTGLLNAAPGTSAVVSVE